MPAARLHLHLFGLFRLLQDDQPVAGFDQARLQQLLAYLALHRAAPISRQQLAFLFWPDSTDQQARKNLRTLLTRLRRALPDAGCLLSVTSSTIQVRPDAPLALDVAEFEAAVAHCPAGGAAPPVMVGLNFTTHLHDAMMVKCYINAYHSNEEVIKQVVDKIMGESESKGTPNDLVWANKWQAKL